MSAPRRLATVALALALTASLAAQEAAPVPSTAEQDRQRDLTRLQERISRLKTKLAASEKREATLAGELQRLELATREGELISALREDAALRLAAVSEERASAGEAVARARRALVARARLLHRFGQFGYFRVLLEARDVSALLASIERLDSLARRDGRLLASHRAAEARLQSELAREQSLKVEIDRLWAQSRQEERLAASLRTERQSLLARERNSAATRRREVSELTDKAARLERLLETLARQSEQAAEPVSPSGSVRPWKGVLDWPAKGTIVETFGRHRHPKFDAWTVSNGIALAVPFGTPVHAVYAGKTVYAQWLSEYGNLVILDHGDGVMTLYAWLQGVSVRAGAPVSVGVQLGIAGYGPGREEPGVYFEVRDRQKASDPVAWLR